MKARKLIQKQNKIIEITLSYKWCGSIWESPSATLLNTVIRTITWIVRPIVIYCDWAADYMAKEEKKFQKLQNKHLETKYIYTPSPTQSRLIQRSVRLIVFTNCIYEFFPLLQHQRKTLLVNKPQTFVWPAGSSLSDITQ